VTAGGSDTILSAKDDKEVKAWIEAIKGGFAKEEVAVTLAKKKQSAMMSIKKVLPLNLSSAALIIINLLH
jgi:hypothetical protein